jgi:hypothetical protein
MPASKITCHIAISISKKITDDDCCCPCGDGGGGGPGDGYIDFFDEFYSIAGPWDNFYENFYVTSGTRPEGP